MFLTIKNNMVFEMFTSILNSLEADNQWLAELMPGPDIRSSPLFLSVSGAMNSCKCPNFRPLKKNR